MTLPATETRKSRARDWFRALQEDICARFEAIEDAAGPPLYRGTPGRFELTEWTRGDGSEDLGGGRMGLMRGKVFEKVGVHFSEVYGTFSEAFAAQILSNTQAFESASFAKEKLGRSKRIGQINWDTFNVTGGSLAIGHPFAATGARQITQTLHELKRRGGQFGLCTACAAGGLGAAMILETV